MTSSHWLLALFLLNATGVASTSPRSATAPNDTDDERLIERLAAESGQTADAAGNLLPHPLTAVAMARGGVPANMVRVSTGNDRALGAFLAGRYEVTNLEYDEFLRATDSSRRPETWASGQFPAKQANHPVTGVSRDDALAYCAWVASHTGRRVSLPTQAQARQLQQGASRGTHAGAHIHAVGSDRQDMNHWGCYDVLGNADEFTMDGATDTPDALRGFRLVMETPASDAAAELGSSAPTTPPPQPYYGAYFTDHPQSQAVQAGARVTLTAHATALIGSERIRYQWYFNGAPLSGATNESYTIANVQSTDVGVYHVEASLPNPTPSSLKGSEPMDQPTEPPHALSVPPLPSLSYPAVIAIGATGTPPTITRQPASIVVLRGDTALVTAAFAGTPPLATRWKVRQSTDFYSNYTPTDLSDFQFTSDDTSTTASYRNPPLGTVTELELTVFGAWGNVTATAAEVRALTEGAVPVITTQPRSVTVTRGSNVTFQVAATGAPTPSFQWFRNGTTLAGANTDTLVLAHVQDAEAGSYTVTVTNSLGTVTSAPATLSLSVASPASAASGGGGGASSWGFNAVAVLALLRAPRGNRGR